MAMNKGADVQAVWDLFYNGLEAVHKGVKSRNLPWMTLCYSSDNRQIPFEKAGDFLPLWVGFDFEFHDNLGYLSSCPSNVGTGMRASVHVNLPAFKTKDELKHYVKSKGDNNFCWLRDDYIFTLGMMIDIRGTRGEATNTDGITIYDVSNK